MPVLVQQSGFFRRKRSQIKGVGEEDEEQILSEAARFKKERDSKKWRVMGQCWQLGWGT
jgi:hypothetical protein